MPLMRNLLIVVKNGGNLFFIMEAEGVAEHIQHTVLLSKTHSTVWTENMH